MVAKFAKPMLMDAGYSDVEGWAEEIVAIGATVGEFRHDVMTALAEADEHTSTVRPAASGGDPFAARRQHIQKLTKKS